MIPRRFILAFALLWLAASAARADDSACSTVALPETIERFRQMAEAGLFDPPAVAGTGRIVPVTIHLVHDDDGNGGATIEQVAQALVDLNAPYLDSTWRYCLAGPIHHINDTVFYEELEFEPELKAKMVMQR